jgi:iron complex transport system substrate-binding protein
MAVVTQIKRLSLVGIAVALVAVLVAGCGGESGDQGSDGETTSGGRIIEHAMGTTTVPENPQRVVVMDTGELDSALTLGVKPVGAVEAVQGEGFPSYLENTEGIEKVGTITEPNLEKIASLNPDLILSSKLRHEDIYDQLSQIAPTVFTKTTGVVWKENFEVHAKALGKQQKAKEVKENYQSRLQEFQQAMGENPWPTVSIVRFIAGDTRIYQKESFIGTVLEDAGLPRPEPQDVEDFALMEVSKEAIPKMDGDVIFTTVFGNEEETAAQEITSDQLWQQLDAVQNERVYRVSDDLWMLGIGYTAANGVLDDLNKYLVREGGTAESTGG